jgi:hypothetical protein
VLLAETLPDVAEDAENTGSSPGGAHLATISCEMRRHSGCMDAIVLSIILSAPWLACLAVVWARVPPLDHVPPSLADQARRRIWLT